MKTFPGCLDTNVKWQNLDVFDPVKVRGQIFAPVICLNTHSSILFCNEL